MRKSEKEKERENAQLRRQISSSELNRKRKVEEEKENQPPLLLDDDVGRQSFGFSFTIPGDKGDVVESAKNFFEGDSSIEVNQISNLRGLVIEIGLNVRNWVECLMLKN